MMDADPSALFTSEWLYPITGKIGLMEVADVFLPGDFGGLYGEGPS